MKGHPSTPYKEPFKRLHERSVTPNEIASITSRTFALKTCPGTAAKVTSAASPGFMRCGGPYPEKWPERMQCKQAHPPSCVDSILVRVIPSLRDPMRNFVNCDNRVEYNKHNKEQQGQRKIVQAGITHDHPWCTPWASRPIPSTWMCCHVKLRAFEALIHQ